VLLFWQWREGALFLQEGGREYYTYFGKEGMGVTNLAGKESVPITALKRRPTCVSKQVNASMHKLRGVQARAVG
jgi:hypothetical protein